MAYSQIEIREYARKLSKGERTLRRWVSQGCDLRNPKSVAEWVTRNQIRETPIERARKRRRDQAQKTAVEAASGPQAVPAAPGNGELPVAGRRGAAAALERLEGQEEESHRRLMAALKRANPVEIQSAQEYWLKCSETLRRLDLAIEVSRRSEEEQIAKKKAEEAVLFAAEWFRIAFMQFLSSECSAILGIKEIGELKSYMVERFKGILDLTVRNAAKTNSAVPSWALERIQQAWNTGH